MDAAYREDDDPAPVRPRAARPAPAPRQPEGEQGSLFSAFLTSKPFQDLVRASVLEVLRSPEGQQILERTVRKELDRAR